MATLGKKKDILNRWKAARLIKSEKISNDIWKLVFSIDKWERHKAGQHYEIKLISEEGYEAVRPYSAASSPEQEGIVEFGVQLLEGGEVSPYLCGMKLDEEVQVMGPIGGNFIWENTMPGPLVLIGGGSGLVPLISILRHYFNSGEKREVILLGSFKTEEDMIYRKELEGLADKNKEFKLYFTLTRESSAGWKGLKGRIDKGTIRKAIGFVKDKMPMIYVCGPNGFVETVTNLLLEEGFNDHEIRTERFGG